MRDVLHALIWINMLFMDLSIDEVDETALVVLPYLVPQKRSKTDQKELIRFFSVRLYNLQLIDGMLFQFLALLFMFFIICLHV